MNPAYTNEAAIDEDMEDEIDVLVQTMQEVLDKLAELNQELESMVSSTMKGTSTLEPLVDLNVNAWDDRKAWEQEFRLHPEANRDEVCSRIYVQVGKLLHRLQERADQHTWNRDDKYMMDGLANIVVLHFRLDKLTEGATKGPKL